MKSITIVIPTYNEEENIELVYKRVSDVFKKNLSGYGYDILFIDNCSLDSSKTRIREKG